MQKKPSNFKKGKLKLVSQSHKKEKPKKENVRVVSLIGKLEKKTEKQMANFVKELVKLKKQQVKLEQKLISKKKTHGVTTKKKKMVHLPMKKKNMRNLKLIDNPNFEPKFD